MNSNIKVYISGRITGRPSKEIDHAFNEGHLKLHSMGFESVSPWNGDEGLTWNQYMKRDIKMLMDCDMILMLEGWDRSKGACIEREICLKLNYPVLYETRVDTGDYDFYRWWKDDSGKVCSKVLSIDDHLDDL